MLYGIGLALTFDEFGMWLADSFRYAHRMLYRIETLEDETRPR